MKLKFSEAIHDAESGKRHWYPARYTLQGQNISPRLEWSDVPRETQEFALVCEDPDAPSPKPFLHWMIYGISPNVSVLPAGLPMAKEFTLPIVARQGKNSLHRAGYTGPNPPFFHGPHRYRFRLFALKQPLPLESGAGRAEFFKELKGKVAGQASLTVLYEKPLPEKLKAIGFWSTLAGALGLAGWGYFLYQKRGR